jgi:replication-associated recombination protein RarA
MMNADKQWPLSELLRPKALRDFNALPEEHILRLDRELQAGNCPNMLLVGTPGLGKTSLARLFIDPSRDVDAYIIDGTNDALKHIKGFVNTVSFTGGQKICFVDDADSLARSVQTQFRGFIENYSSTCRFIFAANEATKIDSAVRSRLLFIHFAAPEAHDLKVLKRVQERTANRLIELDWPFERSRLDKIVSENLADFRRMVNKIEFEFPRPMKTAAA